ncbi:MAG: ATP-binding protein [Planctomycetia bacterium]|nr:MAG: ATP-binding protein [Planctomycetia bacterium]
MKLLEQIQRGVQPAPRRVLLYGTHGVGKSTFGSMAERPIFIQTEDGLGMIDCERFPLATRYGEVIAALAALYTEPHEYRSLVLDSLDWLERLIWREVCEKRGVENIEDIGYAKGYTFALTQWREVLGGLDALRNERGMQIILIAHAQIEKFANPETDTYDRYSPRLQKQASALIQEWCDEILFATYKVHTKTINEGFDRKRVQGIGTGERILRTTERPAHVAKNRLNLPEELPLDYRIYAATVRGENPMATQPPADSPPQDEAPEHQGSAPGAKPRRGRRPSETAEPAAG